MLSVLHKLHLLFQLSIRNFYIQNNNLLILYVKCNDLIENKSRYCDKWGEIKSNYRSWKSEK